MAAIMGIGAIIISGVQLMLSFNNPFIKLLELCMPH